MKFTLVKDLTKDKSMKPILTGLLLFIVIYLLSDILVKQLNFGLFPYQISLTLFGDEEQYREPLSRAAFLEFWHSEIFFIMMLLLTLSAVFIRLVKNNRFKIIFLNLLMLCALLSLVSLLVAYFLLPFFVIAYSTLFIIWHITAIYISLYSLWKLHYDTNL
ncbi:hypothetical protein [Sulfurimonas sp.]